MKVRPYVATDVRFISDSAWRSILHHPMTEDLSPAWVIGCVQTMFARGWSCIVAADDETDVILAWLLYRDPKTVAWLFTKPWHRRKGYARALLEHACVVPAPAVLFPSNMSVRGYVSRLRPYLMQEVPCP